jgi:hypothetical protein
MHPQEFWWALEGYQRKADAEKRQGGGIDEEEAMEMQDELRRYRVSKGFPAE